MTYQEIGLALKDRPIEKVWESAQHHGIEAAKQKYQEMQAAGPTHEVVEMDACGNPIRKWPITGLCGFAWLRIPDGRSPIARYLKEQKLARKSLTERGFDVWGSVVWSGQEMDIKEAGMRAIAEILNAAQVTGSIPVYVDSRLD